MGSHETAGDESSLVPVAVDDCEGAGATGGLFAGSSDDRERTTFSSAWLPRTAGDCERATDFFRFTGDGLGFAGEAARGVREDSCDGAIGGGPRPGALKGRKQTPCRKN